MKSLTKCNFYIMRHGQTTDNQAGIISGRSDPELTENGVQQSLQVREILRNLELKPDKIIVSARKRTHMSAEILVDHTDFIIEPELNERDLGELDGKITEDEQKAIGTLPGEESKDDHALRVINGINVHQEIGKTALFVVHAGTIRRVLESMGFKERVNVHNSQLYHFVPEKDGWRIYEYSLCDGQLRKLNITPDW